ncbi:hypothetical protein BIW11_12155 [Tropilaelaps mercedesae]|uniref:Uncharacterized protein n=1 Tax=Tropilaelaps mercedesae TaxID=418985 RepID=A0A1V9X886_9ACAR|nr:hypothetical protein BIW11_12155 [Tropilaelaps mercedesae]
MDDLDQPGTHKKRAAKAANKVKLVKLSSTEKRTRDYVEAIRKNRRKNHVKANLEKIKRFSEKIDNYSKKALSNDLVRQRLFKNSEGFVALKNSDKDQEEEGASVFTDEDFKRFEEEYNIKFTGRAEERNAFRKMLN